MENIEKSTKNTGKQRNIKKNKEDSPAARTALSAKRSAVLLQLTTIPAEKQPRATAGQEISSNSKKTWGLLLNTGAKKKGKNF